MPNESVNDRSNQQANVMPADTQSEIADPQSNSDVFYGSFSSILMQNLGQYVVVEFLVGTNRLESKEGILYSAGINFITLYDPIEDRYTVCDFYSVRFVTIYNTTTIPPSRMPRYTHKMMGDNMPDGRFGYIPEADIFANPNFNREMSMNGTNSMNDMNAPNAPNSMNNMSGMGGMNYMNGMGGTRASIRRGF